MYHPAVNKREMLKPFSEIILLNNVQYEHESEKVLYRYQLCKDVCNARVNCKLTWQLRFLSKKTTHPFHIS